VVRSVLGRTACRGHQPHHDSPSGLRRLIPQSLPTGAIEARLAAFDRRHNATATTFDLEVHRQ